MIVLYLYGEYVSSQVSIQGVIDNYSQLDKAVEQISKEYNLTFELTLSAVCYRKFDAVEDSKVSLIAENVLKLVES